MAYTVDFLFTPVKEYSIYSAQKRVFGIELRENEWIFAFPTISRKNLLRFRFKCSKSFATTATTTADEFFLLSRDKALGIPTGAARGCSFQRKRSVFRLF